MGVAEAFRNWAAWAAGNAPLYRHLAHVVANDPNLRELARRIPDGKAPQNVLFAAVHASLLRDPDHELAEFYPTVVDDPREASDPYLPGIFSDFCEARTDELLTYAETRRTQTNAVGRSAVVYPAVTHVALEAGQPLALLEVGASAGLNLLFDQYAYEYEWPAERGPAKSGSTESGSAKSGTVESGSEESGPDERVSDQRRDGARDGGDAPTERVGATDSPVTIRSTVRAGTPPIPDDPPPIDRRIGVDLNPLDPSDPADRRWLRALVWPEHRERHRTLAPALDLAAEDPPRLVAGDAVDVLPELVDEVPADVPVCVLDTLVRYQLPDDVHRRYVATLREIGSERDLYWLSGHGEHEEYDQGIPLAYSRPGTSEPERLGAFEMHGRWIEWRRPESPSP